MLVSQSLVLAVLCFNAVISVLLVVDNNTIDNVDVVFTTENSRQIQ